MKLGFLKRCGKKTQCQQREYDELIIFDTLLRHREILSQIKIC